VNYITKSVNTGLRLFIRCNSGRSGFFSAGKF
jgi:hypothetical protein